MLPRLEKSKMAKLDQVRFIVILIFWLSLGICIGQLPPKTDHLYECYNYIIMFAYFTGGGMLGLSIGVFPVPLPFTENFWKKHNVKFNLIAILIGIVLGLYAWNAYSRGGLTHRSTRTLQPRTLSSRLHSDFSSPFIVRLAAPPVNSIR